MMIHEGLHMGAHELGVEVCAELIRYEPNVGTEALEDWENVAKRF